MARSMSNKTRVSPPVPSQVICPAHLSGHVLICFCLLLRYHASILSLHVVDRPHSLYSILTVIVTLVVMVVVVMFQAPRGNHQPPSNKRVPKLHTGSEEWTSPVSCCSRSVPRPPLLTCVAGS